MTTTLAKRLEERAKTEIVKRGALLGKSIQQGILIRYTGGWTGISFEPKKGALFRKSDPSGSAYAGG